MGGGAAGAVSVAAVGAGIGAGVGAFGGPIGIGVGAAFGGIAGALVGGHAVPIPTAVAGILLSKELKTIVKAKFKLQKILKLKPPEENLKPPEKKGSCRLL